MANFFKEEIHHLGVELKGAVKEAGDMINAQRGLTKTDMEDLIRFASVQFGAVLDDRIEKAKKETSDLITTKLIEFKTQLSEAAEKQKKAAIRNAIIGVVSAITVSLVSLLSKKYFTGEVNAIDVYRTIMFGIAAGYFVVIVFRLAKKYFSAPRITKNAIIIGTSYFEILKPKGLGFHIVAFLLALLGLLVLGKSQLIITFLNSIRA